MPRLRAAIAALPKKAKGPQPLPGISFGQRQTLMTLAGRLRVVHEDDYVDGRQPLTCRLADLAGITCYAVPTTAYHIKALMKAGWLYADVGWDNEGEGTFYLSSAIELYWDILLLGQKPEATADDELKKQQLLKTLNAELRINRERTAAQSKAKRRVARGECLKNPLALLKEKIFDMALAVAARSNAGLAVGYLMRDMIDFCTPYTARDACPPASHDTKASQAESTPPQQADQKDRDDQQTPKEDAVTEPFKNPIEAREQEKRVAKLRNELFVLSHRIDAETLAPQVVAFAKKTNSVEELEKKLVVLKKLSRGAGARLPKL